MEASFIALEDLEGIQLSVKSMPVHPGMWQGMIGVKQPF